MVYTILENNKYKIYKNDGPSIQRRPTKMISSLRNLLYEERLKRLGMFSLRHRKLKGDRIEVFMMIHGIDKINLKNFFIWMKIEKESITFI